MSRFITDLHAELIDDIDNDYRGQWRLLQPLVYESDVAGITVAAPAGFITDFESCPRLPLVFWMFGELVHEAAVIHDYLYTRPDLCSRETADAVLKEACLLSGLPAWRAWGIWAGVRLGGERHYGKSV